MWLGDEGKTCNIPQELKKNHKKMKTGLDAQEKGKLQVSYSYTITDKI